MGSLRLDRKVSVWGWMYPAYSSDPLQYDDIVHHFVFTSVFGTLVSKYKTGTITAQIAESWSNSNDNKDWEFKIRKSCFFENGDLITPEIVAQSLKRIALIQKRRGSRSGVMEDLADLEKLKSLQSQIDGITFDKENIRLRFEKPKPDLLSALAFGLYAVVHPNQYDQDGKWLNPKEAISSGPYKITSWSEKAITLALNERQLSCLPISSSPLKQIEISFGTETLNPEIQDVISGSSKSLMLNDDFEFLGPADSDILYLRVYNHENPKSKLSQVSVRNVFKNVLLHELKALNNINFSINLSFLPLTVQGIHSAELTEINNLDLSVLKGLQIRIPTYKESPKSKKNEGLLSYTDALKSALKSLQDKYGIQVQEVPFETDSFGKPQRRAELYDLEMLLTGVIVDRPYEDVEFMFKSKEGIQLPDSDGSIHSLLGNTKENIGKINQRIWNQSIIIPVTHYASGLWVRKGMFNTKQLNSTLPATSFQFIGFK